MTMMSGIKPLLCCAVMTVLPVMAPQASAQPEARTIEIAMSNFRFTPASIRLEHGHPYRLHFVNQSGGGHDFSAKSFFDAAQVAPEDRGKLDKGRVALSGHEEATIRLTAPAAGHYKASCTHFMHSTFGMTGEIVVD
jgi:plastocyanin